MKFTALLAALLFTLHISAQNISGQAFYESKTTFDMGAFGGGNREMTDDMKKMIAERMKSFLEKTYILTFNKTESIYKEEVKLEAGAGGPFAMMMSSYTPGAQYKNLQTKQVIEENEFFGKEFLVTDSIPQLDWQMEKESKQIGQYVAFKATAIKKVDPNDYSMARPKSDKSKENKDSEKNEKGEAIAKKDSVSDDPMDNIEIPTEILVTAWYTPQIPVGNGPGEYAGLPGLILELNVYRTTLLCSKIVMNPKDAENIEPPTKGKEVTRKEYQKIVKEKTDEMRENFQGGNRRGGGRFGG